MVWTVIVTASPLPEPEQGKALFTGVYDLEAMFQQPLVSMVQTAVLPPLCVLSMPVWTLTISASLSGDSLISHLCSHLTFLFQRLV